MRADNAREPGTGSTELNEGDRLAAAAVEARDFASLNPVCDDAVVAGILAGGDKTKLPEASQSIADFDNPEPASVFRSNPGESEWPEEVLEKQRELANDAADSLLASGDHERADAARQLELGDRWAESYEPLLQRASLLEQRRAHSLDRRRHLPMSSHVGRRRARTARPARALVKALHAG